MKKIILLSLTIFLTANTPVIYSSPADYIEAPDAQADNLNRASFREKDYDNFIAFNNQMMEAYNQARGSIKNYLSQNKQGS